MFFYKKKIKKIRRSKNHGDNLQDSNLQTGIRVTSQVEVLRSSKTSEGVSCTHWLSYFNHHIFTSEVYVVLQQPQKNPKTEHGLDFVSEY